MTTCFGVRSWTCSGHSHTHTHTHTQTYRKYVLPFDPKNKTLRTYFNMLYHASFVIFCYDQQMHNFLTNYHTATCFDTIVSSSDSL